MTASADVVAASTHVNRDNYMHMSGQPLRDYAHQLGVSRSEAGRMDDQKLKAQIRIAISHKYEDE